MCGITGIFNRNGEPVSPVILRRMTDTIAHRGPDGEGFYTDSFLGLGHRRLAIIDLSPAGHQPMVTPDGLYAIAYNGEVYNFNALRLELEALGHHFRSRTDSEVVLHAYAEWGAKSVERFNGMFALAIWDRQRQELFLARDRYGIKPLYYTQAGSAFLFGSEVKALLAHPACQSKLDKQALLEYFTFQNFFTPRTLFENVHLLPPGCHMRISLGHDTSPTPVRYWDYCFEEPENPAKEEEYIEELDRLFRQAVNRQLISDVPVGSYLSGGMDSGTITALTASQMDNLITFTIGFDLNSASGLELAYDERSKAEHMSYLFHTEHYEMVLKAGDMERALPRMTRHMEEPRVGQSYPNFYAAQLASKFVKVVLSGAGGDEMFGGYPWRYYRAVVNSDFENYIDKYYGFWQRLIPNRELQKIFQPVWSDMQHVWTRDIFKNVFAEREVKLTRPEDYINYSLYFETKTFLHGLLVVEDKLSMAHGLETRVPFLDNDLVDFAMRLPARLKLGNLAEVVALNENDISGESSKYFQRSRDGKLIMRKVMSKYIPDEVTNRVKQGFSAPDASWFKGESIDYVREKLFSKRARIYEFMDPLAVQDIVQQHLDGKQNRRLFIWSLLNFEHWCEHFLDASHPAASNLSSPSSQTNALHLSSI
ncbi:MAG: asparagine synthase (glutamine-hydrolyzing) [Vampirovibrionales bacterium]|nr:asparagine synthase (glutamine-hydrolyzing) [Vampirovibrionales bacterium]